MIISNMIAEGDLEALKAALEQDPDSANATIHWGEQGKNKSDPLHFVSGCVFGGVLQSDVSGEIAQMLLAAGAEVNGRLDETPLIGATSLGVTEVAHVLIDADADIHAVALFGASALHWASYMGMPTVVQALVDRGGRIEDKCTEFASTPLFWAAQGYSRYGPEIKSGQVEAAEILIKAGADLGTTNAEDESVLERSRESDTNAMTDLLVQHGAS